MFRIATSEPDLTEWPTWLDAAHRARLEAHSADAGMVGCNAVAFEGPVHTFC